eukprot:CAMPEP_0117687246 /NCGR_PEP_ID=MMETSP0804-20121206/23012_1 /TAXON_ID=1074897 /ORGANISM="Tetraselmis astigmatica, Strain CCMP880" /LENGTH=39 /DNA_ID= /DNA_START= /DNA_END= /DNA_ORIENTATION=
MELQAENPSWGHSKVLEGEGVPHGLGECCWRQVMASALS